MKATMRPPPQELDVLRCPLDGTRIVEASAGTGKTWAICALYLRLLLERGLGVPQILVVTFTNAATAELRDRIRQRIVDALAVLRSATAADPFVPALLQRLRDLPGDDDAVRVRRLELALAGFDEAAIFTIHGFCQRALADAPFTAGLPLASELVHDDGAWVQAAANDFWRRRVAGGAADPALVATLARARDTPEKFARLLRRHLAKPTARALWPQGIDEAPAFDAGALAAAHAAARSLWRAARGEAVAAVAAAIGNGLHGGQYKEATLQAAAAAWDELLQGEDAFAALDLENERAALLTAGRLRQGTNKGRTTPAHPFFDAAQALADARADATATLRLARLRLLRELLGEGARALRQAKREQHVVAFDDMLFNLHERLHAADGGTLAGALRERFPAALIDEFQDTDPLQYGIFEAVHGAPGATLFLVGDPKQAIYGFRNADLHTYLRARDACASEYSLAANQRSTPALIEALNGLFGANPRAFMLDGLDHRPVAVGDKPRKAYVDAGGPPGALQVWLLPRDATGQWLHKDEARDAALRACAAEVARLLAAAQRGDVQHDGRPLRAGEIAVLVRRHAEGRLVRQALATLRIGSVELSQASVFHSADAEELERVLAAVLEPGRAGAIEAALATEAMGRDAGAIEALGCDDAARLAIVQRFASWRALWLQRGVGVMLRRWLREEQVAARLLARADGERRLTNWLHLVESLHQAAASTPAPETLLRWLQARRRDDAADEAAQLRLESDRNLVQIVTVHKSKGLEYPVVLCPLLWFGGGRARSDAIDGVEYHDDEGRAVVDFRAEGDTGHDADDVKARVRLEAAAESLRLIYVALTRAAQRCVIVAGGYLAAAGRAVHGHESARSLLNWLAAGAGSTPQAWLTGTRDPAAIDAAWAALAARIGASMQLSPLPMDAGTPLPVAGVAPAMLAALPPPRPMPLPWGIGSYSALVHGAAHELAAADHDLRADAVTTFPEPATPLPAADDILLFPRGAAAGECVHEVFERADFAVPAGWPAVVEAALRRLPPAAGAVAAGPLQSRRLLNMLADVLATPLPVGTATPLLLARLHPARRRAEMEFHLPVQRLDAPALNALLTRHGVAAPRLAFPTLRGFLKGYVDLVFEHEGRHFVLDWKSNHLGETAADYARSRLDEVMAVQGYQLQQLIYGVALHRHLQRRLPGYRVQDHFGGVLYLFVRGLRPGWRDAEGQPTGLHFQRPPPQPLEALSSLLGDMDEAA